MAARQTWFNRYDNPVGYAPGYAQSPSGVRSGLYAGLCADRPFVRVPGRTPDPRLQKARGLIFSVF